MVSGYAFVGLERYCSTAALHKTVSGMSLVAGYQERLVSLALQ
jgi:hypothetical protein